MDGLMTVLKATVNLFILNNIDWSLSKFLQFSLKKKKSFYNLGRKSALVIRRCWISAINICILFLKEEKKIIFMLF